MQIKRIKCPNCGVVLDVKNSKNETIKQIDCPGCKKPLKITFAPQQEPMEAHTYYAPKSPIVNDGATQLGGPLSGATQLGGGLAGATQLGTSKPKQEKAKLMFCGVSYLLEEGQNIVGRKASTSKATIQIETSDLYMSRQHCSITVTTLPDGTKKVVLSDYQNKNQTSVDGQKIETGDAIRLSDGNTITMGKTTVTFKL